MSQTAPSSTPWIDSADFVSPIPIPPNPRVAMRMRSFGETSWSAAAANLEAATMTEPVWRKLLLVGIIDPFYRSVIRCAPCTAWLHRLFYEIHQLAADASGFASC